MYTSRLYIILLDGLNQSGFTKLSSLLEKSIDDIMRGQQVPHFWSLVWGIHQVGNAGLLFNDIFVISLVKYLNE